MDENFKRRLEEYVKMDHEGLFWKCLDELNGHAGFKAHMRSLGRQRLVEPFELISQWIAYNNLLVRRMSPEEFRDLTLDKTTGLTKPEANWMKLQRFVTPLQMSSELANSSRPLSFDAIYFGSSPVSFQAVEGHALPFVSSEWTQDRSSVATVLSRFSLVPPCLDSEPPSLAHTAAFPFCPPPFTMTYL